VLFGLLERSFRHRLPKEYHVRFEDAITPPTARGTLAIAGALKDRASVDAPATGLADDPLCVAVEFEHALGASCGVQAVGVLREESVQLVKIL